MTGQAHNLSPEHLKMLRDGSGISDDVIIARGYRTVKDSQELARLGFAKNQRSVPTLLLPVHTTDGNNSLYTHRPNMPRVRQDRRKRNPDGSFKTVTIKYELPKGEAIRLDCPPPCRPMLADPSIRLWVTEGIKKADALATQRLCAIDLLGVWNFKGGNSFGGTTFLCDWDYIALDGRQVCIVFDSDVMLKKEVRAALDRLTEHLHRKKAKVDAIYLPSPNCQKVGVDDYLLNNTVADLEALIDAPKPKLQPASPVYELLDAAPLVLRKPLALISGLAYLAAWPYVRRVETEGLDADGNVIKYTTPKEAISRPLIVIRSDGRIFGEGGEETLEMLGMDVRLDEIPIQDRLISSSRIKDYRKGNLPSPSDVFKQVSEIVNRFIDFDHSLADQKAMSDLIACYILATWFLDAFNVIGFLWPNGESGSGKTQLLTVVAELSYLGHLILASGSHASLRDLADYGATLCFDDAESLADPKKTDPDKRNLLLAGNRKGNTVPVKEAGPDRTWRTRHVNTYCARSFSAIRLPDPTLGGRTIIIPLVRTADRHRANADVLEYNLWPHDRRKLIDDLWALALAHLAELPAYELKVNQRAKLTGRNLEPWRAILSVALWLEDRGVQGLFERMENISVGYQAESQEMNSTDMTVLVVKAICRCIAPGADVLDVLTVFSGVSTRFVKTAEITEEAKLIAEEQELGIDQDYITERRIGWLLKKLRLGKDRDPATRKRGWIITFTDIQRLMVAFGLYTPEKTSETSETSGEVEEPGMWEEI